MVVPKLPDDDVASLEGVYVTFGNGRLSVADSVPSLGLSPNGESSLCTVLSLSSLSALGHL
jgi:hypothetical protein